MGEGLGVTGDGIQHKSLECVDIHRFQESAIQYYLRSVIAERATWQGQRHLGSKGETGAVRVVTHEILCVVIASPRTEAAIQR